MTIIDDKCFIHIHKTAGTSLNHSLLTYRKKEVKFLMSHASKQSFPREYDIEKFKFYAVSRDPISWYRSFLSFILQRHEWFLRKNMPNGINQFLFRILLYEDIEGDSVASPEELFDRLLNFRDFAEKINLRKIIHDELINHRNPRQQLLKSMFPDAGNIQFKETFFQQELMMFGVEGDEINWIKIEESEKIFDIFNTPMLLKNVLKQESKYNFSDEQKEIIMKRDKVIFEKFGYEVGL